MVRPYSILPHLKSRMPSSNGPLEIVWKIYHDIRNLDELTVLHLTLLSAILAATLLGVYIQHRIKKKLGVVAIKVEKTEDKLHDKEAFHFFLNYILRLSRNMDDNINMSLFMSEIRRKAKVLRRRRPKEIEDRSPELLPHLKVERVVRDGTAILEINEKEEEDLAAECHLIEDVKDENIPKEGEALESATEEATKRDTLKPRRRLRAI